MRAVATRARTPASSNALTGPVTRVNSAPPYSMVVFIAKVSADLGGGWRHRRRSVRNTLLRRVPARALDLANSSAVGWGPARTPFPAPAFGGFPPAGGGRLLPVGVAPSSSQRVSHPPGAPAPARSHAWRPPPQGVEAAGGLRPRPKGVLVERNGTPAAGGERNVEVSRTVTAWEGRSVGAVSEALCSTGHRLGRYRPGPGVDPSPRSRRPAERRSGALGSRPGWWGCAFRGRVGDRRHAQPHMSTERTL